MNIKKQEENGELKLNDNINIENNEVTLEMQNQKWGENERRMYINKREK